MPIRKDTIGKQIANLRRAKPQRDLSTGMMYTRKPELKVQRQKIVLWGLFVSKERTFLLRPHVFKAAEKKGRNAVQWEAWLAENYGAILRDGILPGMELRTGKHWRLYRIIGWTGGDSTRLSSASARSTRHKTKRAVR